MLAKRLYFKTKNISNKAKKFKRKTFEFTVLRSEMVGCKRYKKVTAHNCVHTKPPSAPFSSHSVYKPCSNC